MRRACLAVLCLALAPAAAGAQATHDAYAYGLRTGLFPVHFQAGVSQSHFGSSARVELDLMPGLSVDTSGRLGWANVAGEKGPTSHLVTAGLTWTFVDVEKVEQLSGTVYPEDTPMMRGQGSATDSDLDLPINQRLGGPRMTLPEKDGSLRAPMRSVQGLRLGYAHARAVENVRPGSANALNTLHLVYAGYTWGNHWNLSPAVADGAREVGHKRFYADVLLTLKGLSTRERLGEAEPGAQTPRDFLPVGLRVGLSGAIDALLSTAPGVGLAYQLELGALPGESGLEGYLFLALGLELDARTRETKSISAPRKASDSQAGAGPR